MSTAADHSTPDIGTVVWSSPGSVYTVTGGGYTITPNHANPKEDEVLAGIPDSQFECDILNPLNGMREARNAVREKMQRLNDLASLHEIEALRLRSQAGLILREVNEQTPEPQDL